MSRIATRSSLLALGAAAIGLAVAGPAAAQTAGSVQQSAPAAPNGMVTHVLAIGSLTAKATPEAMPAVLQREVPATLKLYLSGKIDDWYAYPDQSGVVFILNVTTVEEARALLDPLPLGRAGMMTFQLTPLGPLSPLGMLLQQPAK